MSFQKRSEQNSSSRDLCLELESIRRREPVFAINSTEKENAFAIVNTENEIEKKFERDFADVGRNLRNYVAQTLKRPDGTTILLEAIRGASKESVDTLPATEPKFSNVRGDDMQETEQRSEKKSSLPATREIHPSPLDQQLENFDGGTSESLSLCDSAIKLLHGSMKKMLEPEPVNPERKPIVESFTVNAAVKCADSMGRLMKVKLDAIKLAKDLK